MLLYLKADACGGDFPLLTNQTLLIADALKKIYCKLDKLASQIKSPLSIREGGVSTSQSKENLPNWER